MTLLYLPQVWKDEIQSRRTHEYSRRSGLRRHLLHGYQMARQGRAGPALGMAAFGSFIANLSIVGLMLLAPPLSQFAIKNPDRPSILP